MRKNKLKLRHEKNHRRNQRFEEDTKAFPKRS